MLFSYVGPVRSNTLASYYLNNGGSCPASLELLKHAEPQTRIARRVQADGVEWSQVS